MHKRALSRLLRLYILVGCIVIGISVTSLVKKEVQTSKYQAHYLSEISKQLSSELKPGHSSAIRYPDHGPYDQRLGYTLLSNEIVRLEKSGYGVTTQASISPMMTRLVDDYGLFPSIKRKPAPGCALSIKPTRLYSALSILPMGIPILTPSRLWY